MAEARIVFAEHGIDASLEDIARRADVGIGTLYRHFPTRQALIEAAFCSGIDGLRARAEELHTSASPGEALTTWMQEFAAYTSASRGAVESIRSGVTDEQSPLRTSCTAMRTAADKLLTRAQDAGAIRRDVEMADLLRLMNGIAWATEQVPEADAPDRLLTLITEGLTPHAG